MIRNEIGQLKLKKISQAFLSAMEARRQQLELISKRIEQANEKINKSLKYLKWSKQDLKQWRLVSTDLVCSC